VAAHYLIHCISRTGWLNHDRRIRGIGGVNADGAHWWISQADAVAAIEAARWSFFVDRGGDAVPVVVAVSKYGSKYLKGSSDALQPETLLVLPECG
jgi:hypothetical protein